MSRSRPPRRRRLALDAGIAAIVVAIIAGAVTLLSGGSSGTSTGSTTSSTSSDVSACKNTTVSGNNNSLDCRQQVKPETKEPEAQIKGQSIPVECHPEGESIELQAAASIEVHVWCSEVMIRKLVQTKVKVWASNATKAPIDVSLERWALLVPGAVAAKDWSAPPGKTWRHPTVLHLPRGTVTAIPANPDNDAEVLGQISGGVNLSFATHWKKQTLQPGETWHPPQRDAHGERYRDGTLVFYVPLIRRNGRLFEPKIYGLARMNGKKIAALCPIGRWGKRVSAERF